MAREVSFTQKDGFYELPYLINSPQAMIEGYKKMPFIKYNAASQYISAKIPVLDIVVRYREIEEGLFLIYSEVKFKANVSFRHLYDKSEPAHYYCLSLRIDHYAKVSNSIANGISYTDNSWLIFKPGAKVNHHHFKGTRGKYFSLYFTQQWLEDHIKHISTEESRLLQLFLESESDHLICPNFQEEKVYDTDELRKALLAGKPADPVHLSGLKKEVLCFISFFIMKMRSESISERHFKVSNLERIKVLRAERMLHERLYNKFPGVAAVARGAGLSETKLKECFKVVYGKTMFQYFQALQMEHALELIRQTDMKVGQIALRFSYENAGKFAAAFKAYHGVSPSEIERFSI